jgi:NitT/TauT family transport system substrate-binding protein
MSRHCIRGLVAGVAVTLSLGVATAHAQDFKVTLNAPYDGSNAAFFLAEEKGYYAAEGLKLAMDASGGSGEVATRIGTGIYDFGFGDINVLMEFNVKNPENAGKAVYMLYYRSPLSVGSLAKAGINKPADLDGRKLGGSLTDGAYKLFAAYAALANVNAGSVQWSYGDLRLRETMLLRGDVDGILGFDSTMYFNLVRQGIAPSDIKLMYYSDVGLNVYGNAIVASKKVLESNPKAVKGFVTASARGWHDAIANPAAAIAALKKKSPLIDEKVELAKLEWLIKNQLMTDESRQSGLGSIDQQRLAKSFDTVSKAFGLPKAPTTAEVWTAEFLPSADINKLPN